MAGIKTQATAVAVADHLAQLKSAERRADCETLLALMRDITGHEPVMWGPSIVGFGRYRYLYASGHGGEMCATGFASRSPDIAVYLLPEAPGQAELLARLGKHKMGKSCLSIRRLADVDLQVLRELVAQSYEAVMRLHPDS